MSRDPRVEHLERLQRERRSRAARHFSSGGSCLTGAPGENARRCATPRLDRAYSGSRIISLTKRGRGHLFAGDSLSCVCPVCY